MKYLKMNAVERKWFVYVWGTFTDFGKRVVE